MYRHPIVAAAVGLLSLCVFLFVCFSATWLDWAWAQPQPSGTAAVEEEALYRYQGLEPGVSLQSAPEEITDEQVRFSDRVLLRCNWTQEEEAQGIAALRTLLNALRQLEQPVNAYVMTVPLRIGFEQRFSTDEAYLQVVESERAQLQALESRLLAHVSDLAVCIPLMDVLDSHQEEYIFYRSDRTWTALGAYYGVQAFLDAADLEPFALNTFYETAKSSMVGSLVDPLGAISDRLYVYQYHNYNPPVDWLVEGRRQPLISLIRGGVSVFTGVGEVGIFDGLTDNGRVLLLMGGENGAVLAPWMVTQFERIIFVDLLRYSIENLDFWQLLSAHQVTDVLIVEDTDRIASSRVVRLFEDLAWQRTAALARPEKGRLHGSAIVSVY